MVTAAPGWSISRGCSGPNRTAVINCAQLLLGRARYREAMRDRAFVLLPEWAVRWREVLQNELGLSEEVACDLLQEHRRELVYIDTGLPKCPGRAWRRSRPTRGCRGVSRP